MLNSDYSTNGLETHESREEFSPKRPAFLIVLNGRGIGTHYTLIRGETWLGRSRNVQIRIDDDSVSRLHARILASSGSTFLQDLRSTNGTYVNSIRIRDTRLLNGDIVRVGRVSLKYLSGRNVEHEFHREIYRLSTTDPLTHTFNRAYLLDFLERVLVSRERYRRLLSVAMFDIDHFKRINDNFGHPVGDNVLREVATLVGRNLRRSDLLARYGGDEFCVVLPELGPDQAYITCEKLRRLIANKSFHVGAQPLPVTATFGLRSIDVKDEVIDIARVIADADAYLLEAKRSGRNRTAYRR
jgi:diguanylate cyclase (GGDEF)-like protein